MEEGEVSHLCERKVRWMEKHRRKALCHEKHLCRSRAVCLLPVCTRSARNRVKNNAERRSLLLTNGPKAEDIVHGMPTYLVDLLLMGCRRVNQIGAYT